MAKYKLDGQVITGRKLILLANREFTKDSQGRGRYGRPRTHDGAHHFLTSGTNRGKFNLQWWNSNTKRWIS